MMIQDYLVSYGCSGDFACFRSDPQAAYRRGERVVVRTPEGLQLGTVMCPATPGHAQFLSRTAQGELLRPVTEADERTAKQVQVRADCLFREGRRLAAQLELPLEIIDVEILLDGTQAIVHHLRREDCDYRLLVSTLSRKHDLLVIMNNLALPEEPEEEHQGCGKPGCGKEGGGGCTSCGSGGGCGTCGKSTKKEDVAAHLVGLRLKMEERAARTSLL